MIKLSLKELLEKDKTIFSGKVLAFITDTVWGVGVMVDENINEGLKKIYQMKKRDLNKPLAILAPNEEAFIKHIVLNEEISNLFKLWPGALTIIFEKKDTFFDKVTNGPTIGIRIPNSIITLSILKHLGLITTTSVNISNETPLNDPILIEKYFSTYIDYLITDTALLTELSSTVLDVSQKPYKIIRQGNIKLDV